MSLSSPWWNWASPIWLVVMALAIAAAYVFRGRPLRWIPLATGLLALVVAFVSPIGVLANGYLFSAHMVQHLLLLLVVPLCLWLAAPPRRDAPRTGADDATIGPEAAAACWILGVGTMWFWHVPTFCSAATRVDTLGVVRDTTLVLAGLAFWWPIFATNPSRRLPALSGIVYLFSACLGCTLLGIYVTFTSVTVCPAFADRSGSVEILFRLYEVGLTPAVDQHLGGLLMWVPPCLLYVSVIVGQLARWYSVEEPSSPSAEGLHA